MAQKKLLAEARMPVASSQRKRFAVNIASRGVCGRASGRGSPLSFGWNFHREALSDSPAVLLNLRLSAVLQGAEADSGSPSWEDHG
jgi:hypothetical protein